MAERERGPVDWVVREGGREVEGETGRVRVRNESQWWGGRDGRGAAANSVTTKGWRKTDKVKGRKGLG